MEPKDATKINQENKKFQFDPISSNTEEIAKIILDSAYQVHTALGPGLLVSVYEACLVYELRLKNIKVRPQLSLPGMYKGIEVGSGYCIDILVEDCIIVEIKSSAIITPVHCAQLLTYLKLSNMRLGLLLNFNVVHLRNG